MKIWGFSLLVLLSCSVTSCELIYGVRQPAVSKDPIDNQLFNDSTVFPYDATQDRTQFIRANFSKIEIGMSGDEVLEILGNPDEAQALHFVGEPPQGWGWSYFVIKKYARAPDEYDRFVEIFFDKPGRVKKVLNRLDTPDPPLPTPPNSKTKIANRPV
jgi:hypothetical protein